MSINIKKLWILTVKFWTDEKSNIKVNRENSISRHNIENSRIIIVDPVYIYTEGNKFIDRGGIKVSKIKIKNKIKITIRSQPLVILTLLITHDIWAFQHTHTIMGKIIHYKIYHTYKSYLSPTIFFKIYTTALHNKVWKI